MTLMIVLMIFIVAICWDGVIEEIVDCPGD